jgi:hypothetical protein
MNEVIAKLVRDLAWRFRHGGGKYRPKDKEVATWGAFKIPWPVPFICWAVLVALLGTLVPSGTDSLLYNTLLEPPSWLVLLALLYWAAGIATFQLRLAAYKKLLTDNERFMLVEYTKYLKRQIARTKDEPALGGEMEVKRLNELHAKLNQLLQQGAGLEQAPLRSNLADEADLAQAMVETYTVDPSGGLAQLDARLPQELRQRIEELDRASEASRKKAAQ